MKLSMMENLLVPAVDLSTNIKRMNPLLVPAQAQVPAQTIATMTLGCKLAVHRESSRVLVKGYSFFVFKPINKGKGYKN
jgi:hypothetical protein